MKYELTDDEALLLDGRVTEEAQRTIDGAKQRIALRDVYAELNDKEREFICAVVEEAKEKKLLRARSERMRICSVCETKGGYAKHTRSGRNHRKGTPDYSRPINVSGYSFADDFVIINGYPRLAACTSCISKLTPYLVRSLSGLAVQLPEMLGPSRFIRYEMHECTKCGWTGDESEMRRLDAVMGGTYAGGCPKCSAENRFLGPTLVKSLRTYVAKPVGTQANRP